VSHCSAPSLSATARHLPTYKRFSDKTLRMDGTPLRLGTSPFSWTCGRGRFGRQPGGRECSAPPRTTQNACLPLSSRMPPLPPLASQPCARPLTRGIPETPRMPNAAPHVCACGGRPLARGRVWRHRGARARDACVPPSVGVTEPTPPRARGNPDESVAADASGASHGARRAHARERCGACWSSAQRAPEPAYARVT
jgi:hypothetical protein